MDGLLDALSWVLLVAGGLVAVVAGIGLLRLPDLYSRMHAASMLDSLGALCVFLGLALQSGETVVTIKLLLAPLFLLLTTATAAHVLGKSARRAGLEPVEGDGAGGAVGAAGAGRAVGAGGSRDADGVRDAGEGRGEGG